MNKTIIEQNTNTDSKFVADVTKAADSAHALSQIVFKIEYGLTILA